VALNFISREYLDIAQWNKLRTDIFQCVVLRLSFQHRQRASALQCADRVELESRRYTWTNRWRSFVGQQCYLEMDQYSPKMLHLRTQAATISDYSHRRSTSTSHSLLSCRLSTYLSFFRSHHIQKSPPRRNSCASTELELPYTAACSFCSLLCSHPLCRPNSGSPL
jgi:hypothetical protein